MKLSTYFVALLFACASSSPIGAPASHGWTVNTAEDFIQALQNPAVSSVQLDTDVAIPHEAWPTSAILVNRNLTVSSRKTSEHKLLNFTYVKDKMSLGREVHLLFHNIIVAGVSPGFWDVVQHSPNAHVWLRDGTSILSACGPPSVEVPMMIAHPRANNVAGSQRIGRSYLPYCHDARCYKYSLMLHDFSSDWPSTVADTTALYTVGVFHWLQVCATSFSDKCIDSVGYKACLADASSHQQSLEDSSGGHGSRSLELLAGSYLAMLLRAAVVCMVTMCLSLWVARRFRTVLPEVSTLHVPGLPDSLELDAYISAGTFGRVYQGRWQGRIVAIKVIQHDSQGTSNILREVAISRSLAGHANVVQTLHHCVLSGKELDEVQVQRAMLVSLGMKAKVINDLSGTVRAASSAPAASCPQCAATPHTGSLIPAGSAEVARACHEASSAPLPRPAVGVPAAAPVPSPGVEPPKHMQTCIVQELCDLGTLSHHLKLVHAYRPAGTVNMDIILRYALDIAKGMVHLHQHNICHGDLKLGNLLVMSDASGSSSGLGVVKIADFGLSRILRAGDTHIFTKSIGTITHMAPELMLENKLTCECDVYSFGIILWELSTGDIVYPDLRPADVLQTVLRGGRPTFPPTVPSCLIRLAEECWAQDVTLRPTFLELVARLQGLINRERKRSKREHGKLLTEQIGRVESGNSMEPGNTVEADCEIKMSLNSATASALTTSC